MIADLGAGAASDKKTNSPTTAQLFRSHALWRTFSRHLSGRHLDEFTGAMQDLKFALRAFTRAPAASSLVVITLGSRHRRGHRHRQHHRHGLALHSCRPHRRLVFVASTDPRPGQSQAGIADGLARTGVSIPDLADWTDARQHVSRHLPAFTFQSAIAHRIGRTVAHFGRSRHTQPARRLGHHAGNRPHVRRRRSHRRAASTWSS